MSTNRIAFRFNFVSQASIDVLRHVLAQRAMCGDMHQGGSSASENDFAIDQAAVLDDSLSLGKPLLFPRAQTHSSQQHQMLNRIYASIHQET